MAWFFTNEEILSDTYLITSEDAKHIEKSLRMRVGEELTLVSPKGVEHLCEIEGYEAGAVSVKVKNSAPCEREAGLRITLYQCLPKGDKMEYIIQKSVELGVVDIVPVLSSRCVSRPDEKSLRKKQERWQKIALSAAQQSCRGLVPQVKRALSFEEAVKSVDNQTAGIIFYEGGGESLRNLIDENTKRNVAFFIGSEGGFDAAEVELAREQGFAVATLGKRILRAETAPLAALAAIMCLSGNMD